MARIIPNEVRRKPGPVGTPLSDPVAEEKRLEKNRKNLERYYANHEKSKADRRDQRRMRTDSGIDRYESERTHYLTYCYGISVAEYEQMFRDQDGKCASCGREPAGRRLDVDHCHDTGTIRGLLCRQCNVALGLLSESVESIMSLATYLVSSEDVLELQRAKG